MAQPRSKTIARKKQPKQPRNRKSALARLLTVDALRTYAGEESFRRGVEYHEAGAVMPNGGRRKPGTPERVRATVLGTHLYSVEISVLRNHLDWKCDCPVGVDGECCKHVVAVGVGWIARSQENPKISIKTNT
jgi:uncharacterized Zn finger protein